MSNRYEHKDKQAQEASEARGDRPDGHADSEHGAPDASFIAQFTRSLADQLRRRGADGQEDRSTRLVHTGRGTFAALSVPNYRHYFAGQAISMIGTWMQATAQSWLVLTLTHSSTALGLVVALQTLPLLLLAPWGGVIAVRFPHDRGDSSYKELPWQRTERSTTSSSRTTRSGSSRSPGSRSRR